MRLLSCIQLVYMEYHENQETLGKKESSGVEMARFCFFWHNGKVGGGGSTSSSRPSFEESTVIFCSASVTGLKGDDMRECVQHPRACFGTRDCPTARQRVVSDREHECVCTNTVQMLSVFLFE